MLQANINSMITNTDNRIDKNEKIERLMFYKRINDFCRDKPTGGFFSNIKVKSYLKQFEDKLLFLDNERL